MPNEWLADDAKLAFSSALAELKANSGDGANEATTRLRTINRVIFDILKWDILDVEVEKYSRAIGFSDYIFTASGTKALVLEAKKEGVTFVLKQRDYPEEPVPFSLIASECPAAADALRQAQSYANGFGSRYSAITNGHQWLMALTFVSNQEVEERLVFVFESLDAIERKFRAFHECFSYRAIATNLPSIKLLDVKRAPAPAKLSSRIAGYPIQASRNKLLNAIRGVLLLVWDEINFDTDNEVFLENCYIVAEPAADMLRVARELLEQRSKTDQMPVTVSPATANNIINKDAAAFERPIILLGRIGYGKSTFLRYLRHIEAKKVLEGNYIQIDIDFLHRPAAGEDVPSFILDQIETQLKERHNIDVYSDSVVRQALKQELKDFKNTSRGKLLSGPGREAELANAEVEHIETITSDRHRYLGRLMALIRKGYRKSVAIFFDNIDQRPSLQDQAYLRASAIAADWAAMVFVCLRPSTMRKSKDRGVLDTIAYRGIAVSPPKTVPMLRKRFQYAARFCRHTLPKNATARAGFSEELEAHLPAAADVFEMCDLSIHRRPTLAQQFEAVANGNVRLINDYVRAMLTSSYFDTSAMSANVQQFGEHIITEEESIQSIMFGDFVHYSPKDSLIMNLFDISRSDPTEHFSQILFLHYLHRHADDASKDGYRSIVDITTYMNGLGYSQQHTLQLISKAFAKKCVESRDLDEENPALGDEIRITSLGSFHVTTLIRKFVYVDGIIVDTPILDAKLRSRVQDARVLKVRLERARAFVRYLDKQAESLPDESSRQTWDEISKSLVNNITDIELNAAGVS